MVEFLSQIFILLPPILLALTFHEWAHAWTANRLGDPTARMMGRLSLNPLVHLDPVGTLVLIFTRFVGWAKPVPVDTRYLRNPKRDLFWIAGAGPLANLTLALALGIIIRLGGPERFIYAYSSFVSPQNIPLQGIGEILSAMVFLCFIINIALAWFNMLPIPPLDGSKVLMRFLSPKATLSYLQFSRYGFLILLFLVLAFRGVLWSILGPPVALTGYIFGGIRFF